MGILGFAAAGRLALIARAALVGLARLALGVFRSVVGGARTSFRSSRGRSRGRSSHGFGDAGGSFDYSGVDVTIRTHGVRELVRDFGGFRGAIGKELQKALKEAAQVVADDAESYAQSSIPGIGDKWSEFRIGARGPMVYVAPVARATKVTSRKRPEFSGLLYERAMEPSIDANIDTVMRHVEDALDHTLRRFDLG